MDIVMNKLFRFLRGAELDLPTKVGMGGSVPRRAHPSDAGLDLRAVVGAVIQPGAGCTLNTGVYLEIPDGCMGLIADRSSLGAKGLKVHGGIVDAEYRGEVKVVLWNHGESPYEIKAGDRIAQIVILRVELLNPVQVDSLSDSRRGKKGFGSTGR